MSMAEQWLQQGRQQGREEGLQEGLKEGLKEGLEEGLREGLKKGSKEGRQAALRRLLGLKFGALAPDLDARIEDATAEQLDRYLERVLIADSAAAVFAA